MAIFRESGLRDDVTVHRLEDACLKLVVSARARARELQMDFQVEKASKAIIATSVVTEPAPPGSVHHNLAQCDRSRLKNTKQGKGKSTPTKPTSKPPARGRTADAQAQRSPDKSKDNKKGKGGASLRRTSTRPKPRLERLTSRMRTRKSENNEEDAEACEAVAHFSDNEDAFG